MDDVDMLEDDLQLLKSLFEAEGEGLSKPQIEELCAPLAGLLVTMQLDTGILMSNFKQVPATCSCQSRSPAEKALQGMASTAHSFQSITSKLFMSLRLSRDWQRSRSLGCCWPQGKLDLKPSQRKGKLQGQTALLEHAGDVQRQGSGPCHRPARAGQQPADHRGHPGTQGRPVSLQIPEEGAVDAQNRRGQPEEHGLVWHCCHQLHALQGQDHSQALTLRCSR